MQKSSFETKGSHLHGEPKRTFCPICRSPGSTLHMALRGNIRTRAAAHGQNQEGNEEEATSDLGRMESGFATGPSDPVGVFGSCCQHAFRTRLSLPPFSTRSQWDNMCNDHFTSSKLSTHITCDGPNFSRPCSQSGSAFSLFSRCHSHTSYCSTSPASPTIHGSKRWPLSASDSSWLTHSFWKAIYWLTLGPSRWTHRDEF